MSIGAYLDCDECSETPFAMAARGDFRRRLREEAKGRGWKRIRSGGRVLDICDRCARLHATLPTGSDQ